MIGRSSRTGRSNATAWIRTTKRGRHKARVFASALGLTLNDADFLRQALLVAAREGEAVQVGSTPFGILYRVRFVLEFEGRSATVRSGWILGPDGIARLTTALVE